MIKGKPGVMGCVMGLQEPQPKIGKSSELSGFYVSYLQCIFE